MNHKLSVSILNANFGILSHEIAMINSSEADWIHLDIMDGVFVPNISFGMPIVAQIKQYAEKPLDVHLMISNPDKYIDAFHEAGADILTVHYETCPHLNRTVNHIKEKGMKAGVVINPHTPVSVLEEIIEYVDMVLLMSVNPGFGGQKFIPNMFEKVGKLKSLCDEKKVSPLIEIDGGVDDTNISKLLKCGVNVFVVGSFIFKSYDPTSVIKAIKANDFDH
ncbi:MAG TPA: ribulose-phosphate 3-epimerase [Bacteroidales bacterium]|nr:ribulose-phosphate 3-epimerase [Bacteroidales bacterium]